MFILKLGTTRACLQHMTISSSQLIQ